MKLLREIGSSSGGNAEKVQASSWNRRKVSTNQRGTFDRQYPYNSPGKKGWFQLPPSRLKNGGFTLTNLQRAEQALEKSAEKWHFLAGKAPDVILSMALEISEREQQRIGQDLHDGLSQLLTGIAFLSQGVTQKLRAKSVPEADEAARITHLVNQAIVQTRDMARGLYPVHLEVTGLVAAIQELADQTSDVFKISCRFQCDHSIVIHDITKATHLYYIVRESLNNAIKHGKAKHILIGLTGVKDRVILTVKDDGVGLPKEVDKTRGMGLHTMHHRARVIDASLTVQQDPRGGTVVTCLFKRDREKMYP